MGQCGGAFGMTPHFRHALAPFVIIACRCYHRWVQAAAAARWTCHGDARIIIEANENPLYRIDTPHPPPTPFRPPPPSHHEPTPPPHPPRPTPPPLARPPHTHPHPGQQSGLLRLLQATTAPPRTARVRSEGARLSGRSSRHPDDARATRRCLPDASAEPQYSCHGGAADPRSPRAFSARTAPRAGYHDAAHVEIFIKHIEAVAGARGYESYIIRKPPPLGLLVSCDTD